jgi:hypothetical protein
MGGLQALNPGAGHLQFGLGLLGALLGDGSFFKEILVASGLGLGQGQARASLELLGLQSSDSSLGLGHGSVGGVQGGLGLAGGSAGRLGSGAGLAELGGQIPGVDADQDLPGLDAVAFFHAQEGDQSAEPGGEHGPPHRRDGSRELQVLSHLGGLGREDLHGPGRGLGPDGGGDRRGSSSGQPPPGSGNQRQAGQGIQEPPHQATSRDEPSPMPMPRGAQGFNVRFVRVKSCPPQVPSERRSNRHRAST